MKHEDAIRTGIDILNRAIQDYKYKKKKNLKQEEEEEKIEIKNKRNYAENEKRLYDKKKRLFKKILEWKGNFVKTMEFRELFRTYDNDSIIIKSGKWGHEQSRYGSQGCWSRVYLEKSGKLSYCTGCKWMPGPEFFLNKKTFHRLSYAYLKELHRDIQNGKIYRTIARELDMQEI